MAKFSLSLEYLKVTEAMAKCNLSLNYSQKIFWLDWTIVNIDIILYTNHKYHLHPQNTVQKLTVATWFDGVGTCFWLCCKVARVWWIHDIS